MNDSRPPIQANINVDLTQIDPMRCGCRNMTFIRLSQLKFISGFYTQTGQPQGIEVTHYVCMNPLCGLMFPAVLDQAEVRKLYKNPNAPRFDWGRFFINGIAVAVDQQSVEAIKKKADKNHG